MPTPSTNDGSVGWEQLGTVVSAIQSQRLRPERLSGIHNPWGYPIEGVDNWAFLTLCEAPSIVQAVTAILGPDVILWDCELYLTASSYRTFLEREGRYWPVSPLAGAVVLVSASGFSVCNLGTLSTVDRDVLAPDAPLLVIRYMPATSRFEREPDFPANRLGMEERLLVNYAARPLWLVAGEDRGGNDFTTGFAPPIPQWANGAMPVSR